MPRVTGVSTIVGPYPVQPGSLRPAPVESVEASSDHREERPHRERAAPTAQAAYERQARPTQHQPLLSVRDLMTSPVTTLSSDSTLADAWATMRRNGFRHIPIVSVHGVLVGMISDRDVLRHAPELVLAVSNAPAGHRRLGEFLSSRLISATPLTEVRQIARLMLDESIQAVPILDGQRRPIGMLTSTDLLRAIAHHGPFELWT